MAGFLLIPLVLTARWISVGIPITLLRRLRLAVSPHAVKILTWGGLRGGISVALALSVPPGKYYDLILTGTYIVVAFSIIVQGLSTGRLARRWTAAPAPRSRPPQANGPGAEAPGPPLVD